MAIIGSYNASGLEYEKSINSLYKTFADQYSIIIRYLNNRYPNIKTFEVAYTICEISLLIPESINIILKSIESNFKNQQELNKDQIIEFIKDRINFEKNVGNVLDSLTTQLDLRKNIIVKHKKSIELFESFEIIINSLIKGIEYRKENLISYHEEYDMRFIEDIAQQIKSPIIFFSDDRHVFGLENKEEIDLICRSSGIYSLFYNAFVENISCCPLSPDNSICQHKLKDQKYCENLVVYKHHETIKDCLLNNFISTFGIYTETT